jgi:hypothetical protein
MKNHSQDLLSDFHENQTATIGLIIKIPKDYLPGKIIISLVTLMEIKLNLLGMLVGAETDRFNWLSVKATGKMDNLIATLVYLNDLKIETSFLTLNQDYCD